LDHYGPTHFYGILINTGAVGKSTAGYRQYKAYMRLFRNVNIDKLKEGAVTTTFGIGLITLIGSIIINTPIRQCKFHII
jgi:hypothetical protein